MASQITAVAMIVVCAGLFILPFIDRIFHELAPIRTHVGSTNTMQLRLSDLLLTAICYGLGLGIISLSAHGNNNTFLICAGYLLVAELLGLLAAMDVCRKTRAKYRSNLLQRSCIFLIFFLIFPMTLPAAILAWMRWSRLAG